MSSRCTEGRKAVAPARASKRKASVDDGCVIISPPRATRIAIAGSSKVHAVAATAANGEPICGGPAAGGDDEDIVFVGEGRRALPLPHARYDCAEFVLHASSSCADAALHCAHCWCAECQTPAARQHAEIDDLVAPQLLASWALTRQAPGCATHSGRATEPLRAQLEATVCAWPCRGRQLL